MQEASGRYLGKYRGIVTDNADPRGLARLKVEVPSVTGISSDYWALPCVPYAGTDGEDRAVALQLIPPLGANVWVEFESGDPRYPIWTGCYWVDAPKTTALRILLDDPGSVKLLQTRVSRLILNDTDGDSSIRLEMDSPALSHTVSMIFDNKGICFTCGESSITISPEQGIILRVSDTTISISDTGIDLQGEIS